MCFDRNINGNFDVKFLECVTVRETHFRTEFDGSNIPQGCTSLMTGSVLQPEMFRGWTCLGAELVSGPEFVKKLRAGIVQKLWGLNAVSRDRTWFAAELVLEQGQGLELHCFTHCRSNFELFDYFLIILK